MSGGGTTSAPQIQINMRITPSVFLPIFPHNCVTRRVFFFAFFYLPPVIDGCDTVFCVQ